MSRNLRLIEHRTEEEATVRAQGFQCWDDEWDEMRWSVFVNRGLALRLQEYPWEMNVASTHGKLYHMYVSGWVEVVELSDIEQLIDWKN